MLNFISRSRLMSFLVGLGCVLTVCGLFTRTLAEGRDVLVSCEVLSYSQPGEPSAVTCRGIDTDQPTRYLIHNQAFFLQSRYNKEGFLQFTVAPPLDEHLVTRASQMTLGVIFCFFLALGLALIPSAYFKQD